MSTLDQPTLTALAWLGWLLTLEHPRRMLSGPMTRLAAIAPRPTTRSTRDRAAWLFDADPNLYRPTVADLLQLGQQLARSGQRLAAYALFVNVLEREPTNEEALLWLAATTDHLESSVRCLERVLALNPDDTRARRGLEEIVSRSAVA